MNPNPTGLEKDEPREPVPAGTWPGNLPALAPRASVPAEYEPAPASPMVMPIAMSLLTALRRRYKLILALGPVFAALVGVAVWYLIPPAKYTSKALLHVASAQPRIMFKPQEERVDFATYQRTQMTLLKSRLVLDKALNDPKVSKLEVVQSQVDPVLWLEKRIQADFLGEIFRIWMTGEKPNDLEALVNAVATAYVVEVVNREETERRGRVSDLTTQHKRYQRELEEHRKKLKDLTQRFGTKDKQTIRLTHELAIERQSDARRELLEVQKNLRNARAEYNILAAQAKEGEGLAAAPDAAIRQFIFADDQLQTIKKKIDRLNEMLYRNGRVAKDQSDSSIAYTRNELKASTRSYNERIETLRIEALDRFKAGGTGEAGGVLNERQIRIKILEEQEKVTQAMLDAQSEIVASINQDSFYIENILEEIYHKENAAKAIGAELEVMNVEMNAPKRVKLYEKADAPRREEDKRVAMAGMAGLGTFGLFMLGIALLEFRSQRIGSIDEVSRLVGLRVVGALPTNRDQAARGRQGGRPASPYGGNAMAESIDSIRTMILHSTGEHPLRSIMITSATSGEGKTSLACHLAMSLARSGMKTLLIDCDLRKPTIHRLFDITGSPGFCEYLRGEARPEEVLRATAVDGLDAITAGTCDARALRALARAEAGAIFDDFAGSHDIIVVDTSPVLLVTDPLLVGRHVDGAVYSILRDVSRVPLTLSAIGRLKLMNIRLVGSVVTGITSPLYGTYDSGYGGYGTSGISGTVANDGGEAQHA